MKVLIVGSGGREHCLAWKLAQSPLVDKLYCAPGNGGTEENIAIATDDIAGLLKFAKDKEIDLTVVGPEAPLVEGIVDKFEAAGLKIFGPRKDLALLEGSKIFSKEILKKYNIPTADFEIFDNLELAKEYIDKKGTPLVIKADGLAAGKGVFVVQDKNQAYQALDMIMSQKKFGPAGDRIIIEDCLEGEEVSILIFTDGKAIIPLVPSQDHKRAYDNDQGPNTGGMGAYSPAPLISQKQLEDIVETIFRPLVEGLKKEGKVYKGVLYGGLMIKQGKPYVLEFNVRFGDPETQSVLPKLKSDLARVMLKVAEGNLAGVNLEWDPRFCLCVVLASGGYPGEYEKGKEIKGLEELKDKQDIFIFQAGTKKNDKLLTSGGRVLGVAGLGSSIKEAKGKVYQAIESILFDNMHYRKDIGDKALKGGRDESQNSNCLRK
jgi:phosphoribosylamine--glycine ligase